MSRVSVEVHIEVQTFYAQQMRLLDALDIEGYAQTFTEDGVTDHAHRGEKVEGRAALIAGANAALPRYRGVAVRHWNDHYLIDEADENTLNVTYCSLVTRTDAEGKVTFEPTFFIEDVLVRVDGQLRTKSRTVHRDGQAEPAARAS
ncbi:nuclear transport factor 2 family protein [Lentzea jiangxiensis]|uniref:Actinorhodin biosynthesis protein ActVIA/bifunctional aromatase (Cyclase/dehydratase) n=1 Tax=Lentzea jiangxiensis TaxID=641025 RepID=A0A1H0U8G4_9PSEU|nr:nuclear transport factor 2 family protein [Lentzea jiangxiensis]SDP62493.1 actinorhodin biosynthesis protein ActVIA/bifunctional aromatase (cyclase/dehydratase) [Lentzea jiangxiensis]